MFLATASTKRPIAMSCLLIALTVLGLNSYRKISLENLPSVDVPYVTITTTWAGASPEDIEKDIAKKIEDAVSGVEGLKHVNSLCLENVCINTIEFDLAVDVDVAAQNVREKVDGILSELPPNSDRPVIQKLDINAASVATMFLQGSQTVEDLYEYADTELCDRFSNVRGVASVDLIGGNEREIWVEVDREKIAAANLTTADIVNAVRKGIMTLPGGRVRDSGNEYTVQFDAEYDTTDEIGTLEVVSSNGARRYLSDLGTIRKASEEIRQKAFLNGNPGIVIKVIKKSDGNTVEVVNELRRRFESLKKELPPGMELTWVMDDGDIVQKTVDSTTNDIISAVLLCAGILFAFLINVKTTVIVSITMPVTIIISLFFIYLMGLTLNTATLLALGLSAGILVSNSIVVLENVVRRFNDISDRWEAASVGTSEVAVAVLASAGTNVVVMLPIAMMTSIVGRFFMPFAVTTLIVNTASIFISFTLIPILCAAFMKGTNENKNVSFFTAAGRRWDQWFERAGHRYGAWLRRIGDRRAVSGVVLAVSLLVFFFSTSFGTKGLGFIFVENDDWGRVLIRCEFPSYYDLERSTEHAEKIAALFKDYEDLETTLVSVGKAESEFGQANEGVYLAQIELVFKSVYERSWSINDVLRRIRSDIASVRDAIISVSLPGMVSGSTNSLNINMSGEDLDAVNEWAMAVKREVMKNPGVAEIDAVARDDKPQIKVYPNRPIMSDCNVMPSDIATILLANLDGIEAASFKAGRKTIDIRVKYLEKEGYNQVSEFPLPGRPGYNIPFETLVNVEHSHAKNMIYRMDKLRTVKLLGNEIQGYSTQTILNQITALGNNMAKDFGNPKEFKIQVSGMAEKMGEAIVDFAEAIILAVFLTYITLSAILESFTRPFVVLITLPMALIGVIWALRISGNNISIFVLLGVTMLIGVVVNAAVLIVDKMGQLINSGMCRREAMYEAVEKTFRSVLMVITASGLGMLPIAMATGIGAINRIGIGASSVGGVIVAGILTMTVLPVAYVFFTPKDEKQPKK